MTLWIIYLDILKLLLNIILLNNTANITNKGLEECGIHRAKLALAKLLS